MFNWLNADPQKQRQKLYEQKLQQAMEAQRNGDIRLYSELMEEAEALWAAPKGGKSPSSS